MTPASLLVLQEGEIPGLSHLPAYVVSGATPSSVSHQGLCLEKALSNSASCYLHGTWNGNFGGEYKLLRTEQTSVILCAFCDDVKICLTLWYEYLIWSMKGKCCLESVLGIAFSQERRAVLDLIHFFFLNLILSVWGGLGTCAHVCLEAKGWYLVFFSVAHHLIFWDKVSYWPWSILIRLHWPVSSQDPPSLPPSSGIIDTCYYALFFTWVLDIWTWVLKLE